MDSLAHQDTPEPPRPTTIEVIADNIPYVLKAVPQWVCWRYEWDGKKWTKPPFRADGKGKASSTDPKAWCSFDDAIAAYRDAKNDFDGVGFVFTEGDDFIGIDLDDVRDPDTGKILDWANRHKNWSPDAPEPAGVIELLDSYTEVSPSGRGFKIIVQGNSLPKGLKRGPFEMYRSARYFTVTGNRLESSILEVSERTEQVSNLFDMFGGKIEKKPAPFPVRDYTPTAGDAEIIAKAKSARNGHKFQGLYESGDTSGYPSPSEADFSLCALLVFWTGPDASAVDRIFRGSALYRDKWDQQRGELTYGEATVQNAIENATEFYNWDRKQKHDDDGLDAADPDDSDDKKTQSARLIGYADKSELFHAPDGNAYITIQVDGHSETYALRGKASRQWLASKYYAETKSGAGSQAMQDAVTTLQSRAVFDGKEYPVATRVAEFGGNIYLSLSNNKWQAVEIAPAGWSVVNDPPIRFRRSSAMLPLPMPERGGSIEELRKFINVTYDQFILLVAWLIAAMRPVGPYPVLNLYAEQGAGKSTASRVLRALVDPNSSPLRSEPKDIHNLMIQARNSHVLAFDNLSSMRPWLSDAICRLSTGGGFSTRELYSNDDEVIFDAVRPVLVNGIEDIATRSDLLDRSLVVTLPRIAKCDRIPEKQFWQDFDAARPRILGALLDAVAMSLKNIDSVSLAELPRMADFAICVTAAEPALPWENGRFIDTYFGSRGDVNQLALEASPIAKFIVTFHDWTGTPTELLAAVNLKASEQDRKAKSWPTSGQSLRGKITRLAPNLREVGIDITTGRTGKGRFISITRMDQENSVTSVTADTPQTQLVLENSVTAGDLGDTNHVGVTLADSTPNASVTAGVDATVGVATACSIGDASDTCDARNPTHSKCGHKDHQDPKKWLHRKGMVYCPRCDRYMGRSTR